MRLAPTRALHCQTLGCEDCKRIIEALPRQIVSAYLLIDQKWSGFENSNAFERTLSVNKGQPKSKWGFLLSSVSLQTGRGPELSISKAHVRCRFRSLRAASVHGRAESYTRRPNIGMVLRLLPYYSVPHPACPLAFCSHRIIPANCSFQTPKQRQCKSLS